MSPATSAREHPCQFARGGSLECVVVKKKRGCKAPMVEKITEEGIFVYAVNLSSPVLERRLMLFKMISEDADAGRPVPT